MSVFNLVDAQTDISVFNKRFKYVCDIKNNKINKTEPEYI